MRYSTNLTDSQWRILEKELNDNRKRKHSLREIWNALFYLSKTGCQWRMLPHDFPRWQLVYYYFRKWVSVDSIEEFHDSILRKVRKKKGKASSPSMGLVDSQSAKCASMTEEKGIDGNKKINGRKRHIITDTMGLVLCVVVHVANISDRTGAIAVLQKTRRKFDGISKILADQGYTGELISWTKHNCNWILEIVKKVAGTGGFSVLPKRWIVERTFGWFNFQRRLAKDYELLIPCSEAMIHIAMIRIMLRKLSK
jgi:putative transposase